MKVKTLEEEFWVDMLLPLQILRRGWGFPGGDGPGRHVLQSPQLL